MNSILLLFCGWQQEDREWVVLGLGGGGVSDALLIPSRVLYGHSNVSPVVFVVGQAAGGEEVEGIQTEGLARGKLRGKPMGLG